MKRMIFGALVGLGAGYLMWTPGGRELVGRVKSGGQQRDVVDVTLVGTVPSQPAAGVEDLRATV
jgi:hypothetical protein